MNNLMSLNPTSYLKEISILKIKLPMLTQNEIEKLNSPTSITAITFIALQSKSQIQIVHW